MNARANLALSAALAGALAAGCASDNPGEAAEGAGGASGAGGAPPSSGASNLTTGAGPGLDACATETRVGERFPLDLYVMLDASGSMDSAAAGGKAKWEAVGEALSAFFRDPRSTGISAALHFFPQIDESVPASCATSADCNGRGPCGNRVCAAEPAVVPCDEDADCEGGAACVDKGRCLVSDAPCLGDLALGCALGDACVKEPASYCAGRDSCDPADYASPSVGFSPLPGAAAALEKALAGRTPEGETPTSAALSGALARAASEAKAKPGHVAAVLLVTDGLPTSCAPKSATGVAAIAAAGAKGTPEVPTFVVGVFSPEEQAEAKANLDLVASAGATGAARIVGTGGDVASDLALALEAVRTRALPCELVVPAPASGQPDYGKINVLFSPSGGGASLLLPGVAGAEACGAEGGWHYDVSPSEGEPQKITLCPASCSAVRADPEGRLDVVLGCATQIR